jgi:diguanylate cyclase (GGDEF)-like protein/PAS domain S-box-containing protein
MMKSNFYNQSILVVDDSKFAVDQLVKILKKYSGDVAPAYSGKEALKLFSKQDFDIVITDYSMPHMNGIDLSKNILAIKPDTYIILISALEDKDMLKEAISLGVKQYVAKPLDVFQLVGMIESLAYAKDLEKKVAERLQNLKVITAASSEVIVTIDKEGKVLFANDQLYSRVKDGKKEHNIFDLLGKDNSTKLKKFIKENSNENKTSLVLNSIESFGGGAYSCSVGTWFHSDEENYVIIMKDISIQLENSKNVQLFKNVFQNSIEGILITDKENKIITCNKAFETITGYKLDEITGQDPSLLKSGKHDEKFYEDMWDDINKNGIWSGTLFNRRKDGGIYYELLTIFVIRDEEGEVINYVALFSDFNQKQQDTNISKLAYYDILTNLPNRFYFNEYLRKSITRAMRDQNSVGVIYFDLDGFKKINDMYGHHIGDELLCAVSDTIQSQVRSSDVFARLGGDEFGLIVNGGKNGSIESACKQISTKILEMLTQSFRCGDRDININASIGVSIYPKDASTTTDLLKFADIAMYESKKKGKGSYTFYNENINKAVSRSLKIEDLLATCDKDKEFELYYQPQVSSSGGQIVGAEALLRWNNAEEGLISPAEFILVAENSGQIFDIDMWVLKKASEHKKMLKEKGFDFPISVNLSAKSVESISNIENIIQVIDECYPDGGIIIEITESALVKSITNIEILTNHINKKDIYISIDDFGTGYSSLSYLKNIKAQCIKIDKVFIDDLLTDSNAAIIVESMIMMASTMGMTLVAEGVETKEQLEKLRQIHCNSVQGYYFSKPLMFDEFIRFISA